MLLYLKVFPSVRGGGTQHPNCVLESIACLGEQNRMLSLRSRVGHHEGRTRDGEPAGSSGPRKHCQFLVYVILFHFLSLLIWGGGP